MSGGEGGTTLVVDDVPGCPTTHAYIPRVSVQAHFSTHIPSVIKRHAHLLLQHYIHVYYSFSTYSSCMTPPPTPPTLQHLSHALCSTKHHSAAEQQRQHHRHKTLHRTTRRGTRGTPQRWVKCLFSLYGLCGLIVCLKVLANK